MRGRLAQKAVPSRLAMGCRGRGGVDPLRQSASVIAQAH